MQFKNPFIDNLSKVMADAFGAAYSAKNEAEDVFKTWLDGWLAERDFVTREEFEALKLSVEELRNKNKPSTKRKKNLNELTLNELKKIEPKLTEKVLEIFNLKNLKIGVTGTNGKSTTTKFIQSSLFLKKK